MVCPAADGFLNLDGALWCAGGWSPLLSTHQLPMTLRSLSFEPCQYPNTQVFVGGRHARQFVSLFDHEKNWQFVEHLSLELTSLRLFSCGFGVIDAISPLTRMTNLTQIDIDVGQTFASRKLKGLMDALGAVPSLQGIGFHAASECAYNRLRDPGCGEVRMTVNLMSKERSYTPYLEDQMDEGTRPRLSSLVVHFNGILFCPSLHGCSALRDLVLAHCSRQFASVGQDHFSVVGLDAVAGTLTRLVVSTDRALTSVHIPSGLRLQSLMLVCPGNLALHGNVMCTGLKEALLGYAELSGDSRELVHGLGSRLSVAELEVLGSQPLRQSLQFTHPALVGQWWHGVHQKSMASIRLGSLCCRVRVWRKACLCPAHASFAQYGIIPTHADRAIPLNQHDNDYRTRPTWHVR
jgi:hypothetical protein